MLPAFGVPAFVNTDGPPSDDPNNPYFIGGPLDFAYWSDYHSWSLPIGVFNVNERLIAVWINTDYGTGAGSDLTQTLQCRYVTPTSPVELGAVVDLWSMSVPQHLTYYPTVLPHDKVDGALGCWDQQTMGTAIIGTNLYLQLGIYRDEYTEGQELPPFQPTTHDGYAVFVRVDCSGDAPVVGAVREDPIAFYDVASHSGFTPDYFDAYDVLTYCLAAVDGRLLAFPQYAGGAPGADVGSIMELDVDTLATVWNDGGAWFAEGTLGIYGHPEVPFVAHSDTNQSWLMTWREEFIPFTLGVSGITFGAAETLIDDSLTGLTINDVQIYQQVFQSNESLYPTAAMRGPAPNGMMVTNIGLVTWHVWYDDGFHINTMWMADLNGNPPSVANYGIGFDNGPSYGYATRIYGNELIFMPLWEPGVTTNNDIYINVGFDDQPEESLAAFVHEPTTLDNDWAPHVCAAQLANGAGILLSRGDEDTISDGLAFSGRVLAIPFALMIPNTLAGNLDDLKLHFVGDPVGS